MKMSDSACKGSEEPASRSEPSEDDPTNGESKEPLSDKRERGRLLTQQPSLKARLRRLLMQHLLRKKPL